MDRCWGGRQRRAFGRSRRRRGGLSVAATGLGVALNLPLLLIVNTTADTDDLAPGDGACRTAAGDCSLRAAIQEANAHPGPDVINFAIPGAGVHLISAPGGLPPVTDGDTIIDGYPAQPGATAPNTDPNIDNAQLMIEVDGPGGQRL